MKTTLGKIILIEGPDASGKSSTAKHLVSALPNSVYFHSPLGNTKTSAELYAVLKTDRPELQANVRLMLMLTGNLINIEAMNKLKAEGYTVIADRSMLSNLVYQNIGSYDYHQLDSILHFPQLSVDLVFLFTAETPVLIRRFNERSVKDNMDVDAMSRIDAIKDGYARKWGALYPYSVMRHHDTSDSFPDDTYAYCLAQCKELWKS